MKTLIVLHAALAVWVTGYLLLGRLLFPDRLKKWEVMEDMAKEGAQTGCLLLISGMGAVGVVVIGLAVWAWR